MKNLLVGIESVERPGPGYANLANAAGQLSAAFDAYVEVVGVETRPDFRVPSVWDGDWSVVEAMHRQTAQNFTDIYRDVFATGQACSRAIWAGALSHDALGAYARLFWGGAVGAGGLLPLVLLLADGGTNAGTLAAAALLALAGGAAWEYIWVEAGQSVPIS